MKLLAIVLDLLGIHDASQALLVAFVSLMVVVGVLYRLRVIHLLAQLFGQTAMATIRTGFRVWRGLFSWLPWPVLGALVLGVVAGALGPGPVPALRELLGGLGLLFVGVTSCLAYIRVDLERYEVSRGYKALHNPVKGQQLADSLIAYGHRLGFPLLLTATVASAIGFALLNQGLYETIGGEWYRIRAEKSPVIAEDVVALLAANPAATGPAALPWTAMNRHGVCEPAPVQVPVFSDFLTYTLLHLLRVADLLDIANSYNRTHLTFVHQDRWPASTLLLLFKAFFTMVLLQQVFTSIRHTRVVGEAIEDFWSPHTPIYQRALQTLAEHGARAVPPLLRSVECAEVLTEEQRDRVADVLEAVGPGAVRYLRKALGSQNPSVRAVALLGLARIRSLPPQPVLLALAGDPSEIVRVSQMEALKVVCRPGPERLHTEWAIRRDRQRFRSTWRRMEAYCRGLLGWQEASPVDRVLEILGVLLQDPTPLVRSQAAELAGILGPIAQSVAERLAALAGDTDESVRRQAAEALGQVAPHEERTLHVLSRLLADPSASVRATAATALASAESLTEDTVRSLVPLLNDPDRSVRQAATRAISGNSEPTAAAHHLLDGLASKDNLHRAQTVETLGQMGASARAVVPSLIAALDDPNDRVRSRAARALGQIDPDPTLAVPALIRALADPDHLVCARAADSLARLGRKAEAAQSALLGALGHVSPLVRRRATHALARVGSPTPELIGKLEHIFADRDAGVRGQVLAALAGMGDVPQRALFLKGLRDHALQVRVRAAVGLRKRGERGEEVTRALLQALGHANDRLMAAIARTLGRVADPTPEVLATLARLLSNDTPAVQIAAATALAEFGAAASAAGAALVEAVPSVQPRVRRHILRALARIQPPEALAVFKACLVDPEGEVRELAACGLADRAELPDDLVPLLVDGLRDPAPTVRAHVATALGRLPELPDEAVPLLIEASTHPDEQVRLRAVATLGRLRPQTLEAEADRLLADPSLNVRLEAGLAVGGRAGSDRGLVALVESALASSDEAQREAAIDLAGQVNGRGTLLLPLLRDYASRETAARLREAAEEVIRRIEPPVSSQAPVLASK